MGICSAATKAGFEKVVNSVVGPERLSKMDVIMVRGVRAAAGAGGIKDGATVMA